MSDSDSDRSRRRHRRRRTPFVAFYGPMGGNGYAAAGPQYADGVYRDQAQPHFDYVQDYGRVQVREEDPSPPSRRCSWIVEAMERLSAEIKSCGFEPRKPSKAKTKSETEDERSEKDKAVIESMSAKLTKLEDAMKSVQDTLQSCLERARRGQEDASPRAGEMREIRSPVWRQRRWRSPDHFLFG